jgi:predicted ester cyclase
MGTAETERNIGVVREYIDRVTNRGEIDAIAEYVTHDFIEHSPPPGLPPGIAGARALVEVFRLGFEDYRFEIEELVGYDDRVLVRGWGAGRHVAPFLGIAPTGRDVRYRAAHVFLVRDGRLAARWAYPDTLGLLQQLGALPAPGR